MKTYVLTEGPADALLVERVVRDRVPTNPQVLVGGGRSSVVSLAKSILISRPAAVAVLLDADTLDHERVASQEREWSDLLRTGAKQRPFRIIQAVPQIEVVLFESDLRWEAILGKSLQEWGVEQSEALARPSETLRLVLDRARIPSRLKFYERVDRESLAVMAEHPVFQETIEFLRNPSKRYRHHDA